MSIIPRWKVYFKVAWACRTPFVVCLDRKYRPLELEDLVAKAKAFPPGGMSLSSAIVTMRPTRSVPSWTWRGHRAEQQARLERRGVP
jgi:hypothetical protein